MGIKKDLSVKTNRSFFRTKKIPGGTIFVGFDSNLCNIQDDRLQV